MSLETCSPICLELWVMGSRHSCLNMVLFYPKAEESLCRRCLADTFYIRIPLHNVTVAEDVDQQPNLNKIMSLVNPMTCVLSSYPQTRQKWQSENMSVLYKCADLGCCIYSQ